MANELDYWITEDGIIDFSQFESKLREDGKTDSEIIAEWNQVISKFEEMNRSLSEKLIAEQIEREKVKDNLHLKVERSR